MHNQFLGPFLCKPSETSMGFWMSGGPSMDSPQIKISVSDQAGVLVETVALIKVPGHFGVVVGETSQVLKSDTKYSYKIQIDDISWMPKDFSEDDLQFLTLPDSSKDSDFAFALISCHGIEAYEQMEAGRTPSNAWAMWHRLNEEVKANRNCRIGILGGDQVYMDDTFGEDLRDFDSTNLTEARLKIFRTYSKYWGDHSYRKILARLPCMLMWDDHDIIDGWGSREEAFLKKNKQKWSEYGNLQKSAFWEMQGIRNPGKVLSTGTYSFKFCWKRLSFLGLDLRSDRKILSDSHTTLMMSTEHKNDIAKEVRNLAESSDAFFIISPVTVARMGGSLERLLAGMANFFWSVGSKFSYGPSFARVLVWFIPLFFIYSALHLNTTTTPGFMQASFLVFIAGILLVCSSKLKVYFPNLLKPIKSFLWISILFGCSWLIFLYFRVQVVYTREITELLADSLPRAFKSSIEETAKFLTMAFLSVVCLRFSTAKKHNKKVSFRFSLAGYVFAFLFVVFNFWRGLPGWDLDWIAVGSLIISLFLIFFLIITFVLSILEANGGIDSIAGLDDDIRDGWSSEGNSGELHWLTAMIAMIKKAGVGQTFLLCGDIHTGGLSRLKFYSDAGMQDVPQITSSPISYVTMPYLVEKLTSGSETIPLVHEKKTLCEAINVFFRSKRNFSIVNVDASHNVSVEFHFEDLDQPVVIKV